MIVEDDQCPLLLEDNNVVVIPILARARHLRDLDTILAIDTTLTGRLRVPDDGPCLAVRHPVKGDGTLTLVHPLPLGLGHYHVRSHHHPVGGEGIPVLAPGQDHPRSHGLHLDDLVGNDETVHRALPDALDRKPLSILGCAASPL